jgi:hypothetical protein
MDLSADARLRKGRAVGLDVAALEAASWACRKGGDGMPHADAHLDELRSMLWALAAEHDGLDLYGFDGFVAGLLVCPEMIMPSEWLPVVWGDDAGPGFESLDQAQRRSTQ